MQTAKALRKEKKRRSRNRWKTKQSFKNKVVKQLQTFAPYIVIMLALAGIFFTSQYGKEITGFVTGTNESTANNAPEWQGRTVFTLETSQMRTIDLKDYVYEQDEDELIYRITKDSGIDAKLQEDLIIIDGDSSTPGEHEINVRISDGKISIDQRLTVIILQSIEEVKKKKAETEIETELLTKDEVKTIIVLKQNTTSKDLSAIKESRRQVRDGVKEQLTRKGLLLKENYDASEIDELNGTAILIAKITKQGLAKLEQNNLVESIFIDRKLTTGLLDSVPLINATNITINGENGTTLTGKGQTVCIVDTGIDNSHDAFAGRIIDEKCFCSITDYGLGGCCANNASTYDIAEDDSITSHGTYTAGIIASNGTIKGVAPESNVVIVKACDNTGQCAASDVLKAIDYCNDKTSTHNVSVMSGSFGDGQEYNSTNCPTYIDSVLNTSNALGISTVFSAGNEYFAKGINYPACSPFTIAVGASTKQDNITDFSNKGELLDVLAPGAQIQSTLKGGYGTKSGTSMSTAHVAGGILLIKERDIIENKSHTPEIIKSALKQAGANISTWPRVDIGKTISIIDSVVAENATFNGTNETIGNEIFHVGGGAAPAITLNTPANASISVDIYRDMNITVSDPESDVMNVSIYGDNISTTPTDLLAFYQNTNNGSLTYNWTKPTIWSIYKNDQSLIGHWKLDKNLSDSTGNLPTGTITGGAKPKVNLTAGQFGGGFTNDGTGGNWANLTDSNGPINNSNYNITIAVWVKINKAGAANPFFSSEYSTADIYSGHQIGTQASNKIQFLIGNGLAIGSGARINILSNTSLAANQWYLVAATAVDKNTLKIYLNGVDDTNYTSIGGSGGGVAHVGTTAVGVWAVSGTDQSINGTVDEVAFWNRTLSAAEISALYSLGNGTYYWNTQATDGLSTTTSGTNKFILGADVTKPNVSDARPTLSSKYNVGNAIEIAANATDDFALDTVWANITMPNASTITVTLTATGTGNKFNNTYTIPSLTGLYNLTLLANDTSNNINSSITTNFSAANVPTVVLNSPINNTGSTVSNRLLNITVADPDSNAMNVSIYADNTTSANKLVAYFEDATNSTITYNYTSPTIDTLFQNDNKLGGYWKFDINASDHSSNGNNGVVDGATLNKSGGYLGGAYRFDGVNDQINFSLSASLSPLKTVSLSAWVYLNTKPSANYGVIIVKGASTVSRSYTYRLIVGTDGTLYNGINSETQEKYSAYSTLSAGTWYHIATSMNATEGHLYVNGTEVGTAWTTGTGENLSDSNYKVFIGGASGIDSAAYINGTIDDVAIFNRSLSAAEVLDLYRLKEGMYYWKAEVNDAISTNTSETRQFSVDSTKPAVSDPRPTLSSSYDTGTAIEIAANATDSIALDTVWANITMPNASTTLLTLVTATGNKFNGTYTIPSLTGLYNITFNANDTANNINNSITTNFTATAAGGNNVPTKPTLTDPTNGNTTATNRTPILRWSASTDADSDPIMYNITLECTGTCSPYTQYIRANTTLLNFTVNQSLQVDIVYKWNVTADDFVGGSNVSSTFNFTVASLVSATLTNSQVDFGALAINVSADTTTNNPLPLRIRNDGNVYIDINLTGDQSPWSTVALNNVNFQTKAGGGGTINSTTSLSTFTNIATTTIRVIGQLNFSPDSIGNTSAEIELNITVPETEPPGQKEANMTISAAQTT